MDETWIVRNTQTRCIVDWAQDVSRNVGCEFYDLDVRRLPNRTAADRACTFVQPATGKVVLLALLECVTGTTGNGVRMEIVTDPTADGLTTDELRRSFGGSFAFVVGATGRRTGLLLRLNGHVDQHCGRPILPCNIWLEEKLTFLEGQEERKRLMTPWLRRYRATVGVNPADPSRSFRCAIASCEKRLALRSMTHRSRA
jgi:hypothetical protein